MKDLIIRPIGRENACDIKQKNEPFRLFGRLLPAYENGVWRYETVENDSVQWDCFPDEDYDFEQMEKDYLFLGAYDGERCVGLAVLALQPWKKHLYLHDLKVQSAYRRQKVAARLLEAAYALAKEWGYLGLWTIGQDTNLGACLLYLACGFRIGGLDTEAYRGTRLEGTADVYFYRDDN